MGIEFDSAKSARNETERGLSFMLAAKFEFMSTLMKIDARRDYGEIRYSSIGYFISLNCNEIAERRDDLILL